MTGTLRDWGCFQIFGNPKIEKQANLGFMKQMGGWVYIMCSNNHSTLYVGVTSNIASRVYEHKEKFYPTGFSAKYNCVKLFIIEDLI
jgi:hypothetical protein